MKNKCERKRKRKRKKNEIVLVVGGRSEIGKLA